MPMATDRTNSWEFKNSNMVLSIECLKGSSTADEWTSDMLQTGDIVEEIKIGNVIMTSPFKNGRAGVMKLLHSSYKSKETSVRVRVRRGSAGSESGEFAELQACVVPWSGGSVSGTASSRGGGKQYMLRAIDDPNYAVGFVDRSEAECLALQSSRSTRVVSALATAQLQDGYVAYPWEKRMQESLSIPNSSCFLSVLFLPKGSDRNAPRYNDLDDTLTRANAWLNAAQASGVPIVFMNIQTESLLTKISGETASTTVNSGSLSDLSELANVSLYGFEDYHGVDIGVVRAVRLWYAPLGGEVAVEIKLREGDIKLGFAIGRTEEGFIYVSSVIGGEDDVPSNRSGLSNLYKEANMACKLLIVSRISNQKVLPWMVSTAGGIRCFDTVSLSQKLSLHRHAKVPIVLHVFSWDREFTSVSTSSPRVRATSSTLLQLPPDNQMAHFEAENHILPPASEISPENRIERDTAGESSFRFHDFSLPNNWV